MDDFNAAMHDYYEEYNKRKNTMLSKLETIKNDVHTNKVYKVWCEQVIEFIKEQKG